MVMVPSRQRYQGFSNGVLRLQYGCLVVNAPTANTIAAAEHGIALLCALTRNVAQADASVKRGEWKRTKYVGVSLVGKTLAIMGFGKVLLHLAPLLRSPAAVLPGVSTDERNIEHTNIGSGAVGDP